MIDASILNNSGNLMLCDSTGIQLIYKKLLLVWFSLKVLNESEIYSIRNVLACTIFTETCVEFRKVSRRN